MYRRLLCIFIFLGLGALCLRAQDLRVARADGPAVKADTVEMHPPILPFGMGLSKIPAPVITPPTLLNPNLFPFETRAQRAARVGARAYNAVMSSVGEDLKWHRMPQMSRVAYYTMLAARPFLTNAFDYPDHYAPLVNPYFPFISVYVPGQAPYAQPYSPEFFPQAIRAEFNLATGTYNQVMVDWGELQRNMARSFGGYLNTAPVPSIPVTPVERSMLQQHP